MPGGEAEIAARVKHEGRSARLDLGNGNNFYVPSYPGTPRDLSEKERPQCAPASPSLPTCECLRCKLHHCEVHCVNRGSFLTMCPMGCVVPFAHGVVDVV